MVISDNRKPSLLLMVLLLFSTQACTDIFLSGLPQMAATFNETMLVTNLTISIYNYSQAFLYSSLALLAI